RCCDWFLYHMLQQTTIIFLISGTEDYSDERVFNSNLVSVTEMKDFEWAADKTYIALLYVSPNKS
ncbi:MAG: hypothetical protein WBZ36_26920, partial [Candidatus Nitrosopolaris sp.]